MDHAAYVMSMMVMMTTGLLMDEFAVDMAEFVSACSVESDFTGMPRACGKWRLDSDHGLRS